MGVFADLASRARGLLTALLARIGFVPAPKAREVIREVIRETSDFPPDSWVMAQLPDGARMWVDLGDLSISRACMTGAYEVAETAFIRRCLKPGDTFIDIGANIGWFSLIAGRIVGEQGKVFAFEPRGTTFRYLTKTMQENGLAGIASTFNCALADQDGMLDIAWERGTTNPGGTWLLANESLDGMVSAATHARERVKVRRLDDFDEVRHADLIKIDVEGAEPLALRGAERLLMRARPMVLAEMNSDLLKVVGRSSSRELMEWMGELGYRCYALDGLGPGTPIIGSASDTALPPVINVIFMPAEKVFADVARGIFPADRLPSQTGRMVTSCRMAEPGMHACGYLSYGPDITLSPGSFRVKVRYAGSTPPGQEIGFWDIYAGHGVEGAQVAEFPLRGTGGDVAEVDADFEVSIWGQRFQFRTYWHGASEMRVYGIELSRLG